MNKTTQKTVFLGVFAALAMVFSYIEVLIPPIYSGIPGIKMGLPNIVIIFILYRFGVKEAAIVSGVRILLTALLFGNFVTLAYSTAGALLSLSLMALTKRLGWFSTVGVSVIGGVSHNLGQILVAIFLLDTLQIGYYMIVLTITGTIAGVLVGIVGSLSLKYINQSR